MGTTTYLEFKINFKIVDMTMNLSELLEKEIAKGKDILSKNNLFKHIIIPDFNCSTLPPETTDGKNLPEDLKRNFFSHLHQFDTTEGDINSYPCLYIFELVNPEDAQRVLEEFNTLREKGITRRLPALKRNIQPSPYLYIGKRQQDVGGRLVEHLGYHQKDFNHGLQLVYWSKNMLPCLQIKVHVLRFDKDFLPFLSAFEVILAKKLKPLIGKH